MRSDGNQATQPLAFSLFFVDLGPEFASLGTELLSVSFERNELLPPELGLCHEEVEAPRQASYLSLQIVSSIDERGGSLANGSLNGDLCGAQAGCLPTGHPQGADAFDEGGFLRLLRWSAMLRMRRGRDALFPSAPRQRPR